MNKDSVQLLKILKPWLFYCNINTSARLILGNRDMIKGSFSCIMLPNDTYPLNMYTDNYYTDDEVIHEIYRRVYEVVYREIDG